MNKEKILSALLVLLCWAGIQPVVAQIALSPSFVFIDGKSGVGDLYVSNKGDKPYEVSISFAFGYPSSDSAGNQVMNYSDSAAYKQFALDPMVRAFPRSFILAAGKQRTVRIQVVPGERKKEGFFYTRLKVMAKPQSTEVTETTVEGVSTKISFNFEQITAVFYHRGKVSTGIKVKKLDVTQVDTLLQIRSHLKPTGNAPFIGSMFAKLKDTKGSVLAESQGTTTVYFDVIRSMDLKIAGVPRGTYTLELSFETRRNDMIASDLVQAPPTVFEQPIVIR